MLAVISFIDIVYRRIMTTVQFALKLNRIIVNILLIFNLIVLIVSSLIHKHEQKLKGKMYKKEIDKHRPRSINKKKLFVSCVTKI